MKTPIIAVESLTPLGLAKMLRSGRQIRVHSWYASSDNRRIVTIGRQNISYSSSGGNHSRPVITIDATLGKFHFHDPQSVIDFLNCRV